MHTLLLMYMFLLSVILHVCVRVRMRMQYSIIKLMILSLPYIISVDKNYQILRSRHNIMASLIQAEVEVSQRSNGPRLTMKGWTNTFFGIVQRTDSALS